MLKKIIEAIEARLKEAFGLKQKKAVKKIDWKAVLINCCIALIIAPIEMLALTLESLIKMLESVIKGAGELMAGLIVQYRLRRRQQSQRGQGRTGPGPVWRLVVRAIVLAVIANAFWPELPERIPTIYSFFQGGLEVIEFTVKCGFKGIYSLVTDNWDAYATFASSGIHELWSQFISWLEML